MKSPELKAAEKAETAARAEQKKSARRAATAEKRHYAAQADLEYKTRLVKYAIGDVENARKAGPQ